MLFMLDLKFEVPGVVGVCSEGEREWLGVESIWSDDAGTFS